MSHRFLGSDNRLVIRKWIENSFGMSSTRPIRSRTLQYCLAYGL